MQYVATAFRGTPFHRNTSAACMTDTWFAWGEYVIPDVFHDMRSELRAIRQGVALLEMSPLPKYDLVGPDAGRFVDFLITRDCRKLEIGHAIYSPFCNEEGLQITSGVIFRFAENHYRLTTDYLTRWLAQWKERFDVEVRNVTDDYGILSLQGPRSTEVLEKATNESWAKLSFSRTRKTHIEGAEVQVARQGFTGERGYELFVARPEGFTVWDAIERAGKDCGIVPAGSAAHGIARVEAGLIMGGADYTKAGVDVASVHAAVDPGGRVSPFDLGLGRFVDLEKSEFLGKSALRAIGSSGRHRTLVGMEIDWTQIASNYVRLSVPPQIGARTRYDSMTVLTNGRHVGRLSSASWSPTISRLIGFGLLDKSFASVGTKLEVEWRGEQGEAIGAVDARVVGLPFVPHRRSA
jgi:aminomethyltransferase